MRVEGGHGWPRATPRLDGSARLRRLDIGLWSSRSSLPRSPDPPGARSTSGCSPRSAWRLGHLYGADPSLPHRTEVPHDPGPPFRGFSVRGPGLAPGKSEGRRRCRRPYGCDALALVPALPCLDDVGRACEGQQGDDQSDRLPPDIDPHRQSQRIPAPMVRAIAARSVRAQVKRKSLAFTPNSFRSKGRCTPGQATGRSQWDPWLCVPASRRVCRYNRSSEATSVSLGTNAMAGDPGFQWRSRTATGQCARAPARKGSARPVARVPWPSCGGLGRACRV